jgi:hypothetical protein
MGLCLFIASLGAIAEARVEPIGTWSCIGYGHPVTGDERFVLRFDPNGDAHIAHFDEAGVVSRWSLMSGWEIARKNLHFSDRTTARMFTADLDYPTLGGTWTDGRRSGGWWCAAAQPGDSALPDVPAVRPLPPLVTMVSATPWYPRAAIRRALEGHAVACFMVGADGFVRDPEFVELSDEMFELPSLGALSRSRYAAWQDGVAERPACRSFEYHLDERVR